MSFTTTLVVALVVIANILACLWLIRWTSKRRINEEAEGSTKSHVWDGDLQEFNNPLPRWWLNMFILSIVFGIGYLVVFPGLGGMAGVFAWSSAQQHDERLAAAMEKRQQYFASFEGMSVDELADNTDAIRQAGRIFADNCAGCHGPSAGGAPGFPNLADGDWLYGGSAEQILASIQNGRNGFMPPQEVVVPADKLDDLVALIGDWPEGGLPADRAAAAKATFMQSCAMCHGPDGSGNIYMGAPNITDDIWLYGGDADTIKHTILRGRKGEMPAHKSKLSDIETKLLAGYLRWLSRDAS